MNTSSARVEGWRSYARKVRATMPSLRAEVPPQFGARCDAITTLAAELDARADRRLSIATVGEFSTGKSLLLSVLLGRPDLLRVSSVPTTANVTAVRLRVAQAGVRPGPPAVSISYLSLEDVDRLTAHLLDRVVRLVVGSGLAYPKLAALDGYRPVTSGWQRFEDAVASVWDDILLNPKVRMGLWELTQLRDALAVGRDLLPARTPGPERSVDADIVASAVEIGRSRRIPALFPATPADFPAAANALLTASLLERTLVLVHRVNYDVTIAPEQWQLGDVLRDQGVELLDFPGRNSAGGGRDEYLALSELRQVTGLLIAVDAARPETEDVLDFSTFLEQARTSREQLRNSQLVVACKFDTMKRSDADLTSWSSEFDSLNRITGLLTGDRPQLTSYVSALAAVDCAGLPRPEGAPEVDSRSLAQGRAHWRAVAAAQEETGRAAPAVITALREYAEDGGIAGLRRRLGAHVAEHGMAVHLAEMEGVGDRIRDQLIALQRVTGPIAVAPGPATSLRARLIALSGALSTATDDVRTALAQLRHAGTLPAPEGEAQLLVALRSAVAAEVYAWDEWRALARSVQKAVVVAPAAVRPPSGGKAAPVPGLPGFEDFDEEPEEPEDGDLPQAFPDSTTSFRAPLARSLAAADKKVDELLVAAVRTWVDDVAATTVELRERLADEQVTQFVTDRTRRGPEAGRRRVNRLRSLTDLTFVVAVAEHTAARIAPTTVDGAPVEDVLPVAVDRALPWHQLARKDADRAVERVRLHQTTIFRHRRDVANAVVDHAQRRLGQILAEMNDQIAGLLKQILDSGPTNAEITELADGANAEHHEATWTAIQALIDSYPRPTAGPDDADENGSADD